MQLRHEYKHLITRADYLVLRTRLAAVMRPDPHAGPDGCYHIRSLYFDTPTDRALREKLDGVSRREKFRIRCYNGSDDLIRLEKKLKVGGLGAKVSAQLTREETLQILAGDTGFLLHRPENVMRELYTAMRYDSLQPRTLVDYTRLPFVYPPGNVRVTLDYDIRTGVQCTDLFSTASPTLSAAEDTIVLEVKYDNFLPDVIRDVIQLPQVFESAFSKYAACRRY